MAGQVREVRVELGVPVDLVEQHVRVAPLGVARAAPGDGEDRGAPGGGEAERAAGGPCLVERLGDLRVDRDVVGLRAVELGGPADGAMARGRASVARHRRVGHVVDEPPRALVRAGRAVAVMARGERVDDEHVRVRARGGALPVRDVRPAPLVPRGLQPDHDPVRDRPVVGVAERRAVGGARLGDGAQRERRETEGDQPLWLEERHRFTSVPPAGRHYRAACRPSRRHPAVRTERAGRCGFASLTWKRIHAARGSNRGVVLR